MLSVADEFWITIVGIYATCIVACIINIFAALTKKRFLTIPFILLRFLEIAFYFTFHVNYMLYMKKSWNLGVLIAACCAGGFIILFLLYMWGVTISMYQIIGVVNSKQYKAMLEVNRREIAVVKKPRYQEVASIAPKIDYGGGSKMLTSDFYGVNRNNIRRIY